MPVKSSTLDGRRPLETDTEVPSSGFRDLVRHIALGSGFHPVRVAIRLAGSPCYKAALFCLKLWARSHRYIAAVLLTGSGAGGPLRYGVSDLNVLVLVRDGDMAPVFVDRCEAELKLLKRLFPVISVEALCTRSQFRETVLTRYPFLLSIPGFSIYLFLRDPGDSIRVEYQPEHELRLISFLWHKVLAAFETAHRPGQDRQGDYLRKRLAEQLALTEDRLSLHPGRHRRRHPSLTDLVRWHGELTGRLLDRLGHSDRPSIERAGQEARVEIPNQLFFESTPVAALFGGRDVRPVLRVHIPAAGRDPASLARDLLAHGGEGDGIEYFSCRGLLLPLAGELDVLYPHCNPFTFDELMDAASNGDRGGLVAAADLGRCVERLAGAPDWLCSSNEARLQRLADDRNPFFEIPPQNLGFAAFVLAAWKCRRQGCVSRDDVQCVQAIEQSARDDRSAEARFQLMSYTLTGVIRARPLSVSVLIATRNRSELLDRTLESLRRQSLAPAEIIVADNGSTDDTAETVERHARLLPVIHRVEEPRPGIPHARNQALEASSPASDVVAFIDDDCVADPDWLQQLTLPFRYDDAIVSTGGYVVFEPNDATLWGEFYIHQRNGATV